MLDRATFLSGLLAAAVSPTPDPWDACETSKGLPFDRPIELKMPVLDGKDFRLSDYRGKAVLLNIFATWCGPCNYEEPHLVQAAEKYAPQGLSVIGINDREEDDTVRAFRKKYGITFPIAMDRKGGFTVALQNDMSNDIRTLFPVSLFITPYGYLYCYKEGAMRPDEMAYRIEMFLELAPPPTPGAAPSASQARPTRLR